MQPQMCARCKKNAAVVFVTKYDGVEAKNEGLCLKCAKQLGIKPIDDMIEKMGLSEDDLDNFSSQMAGAMGELENLGALLGGGMEAGDDDSEGDDGKTATFPFMNRLFGGMNPPENITPAGGGNEKSGADDKKKGGSKKSDTLCAALPRLGSALRSLLSVALSSVRAGTV